MRNDILKPAKNRESDMSTAPDDLELLLTDVRKTISDNLLFLKTLKDDAADVTEDEPEAPEENATEEDFEEL